MNEHDDLVARSERALAGNLHAKAGAEADKLARQNKLFVRDRIALLFAEGSFVEDGLLANTMALPPLLFFGTRWLPSMP